MTLTVILAPLEPDHGLVKDRTQKCAICHQPFTVGERVTPQEISISSPTARKKRVYIHARCALVGYQHPKGEIAGIQEGRGVIYPVRLKNGDFVTFGQLGIQSNESS